MNWCLRGTNPLLGHWMPWITKMLTMPSLVVAPVMTKLALWQILVFGVSLIARFVGPTWGPPGTDRSHVGPMWTPWKLLSVMSYVVIRCWPQCVKFRANQLLKLLVVVLSAFCVEKPSVKGILSTQTTSSVEWGCRWFNHHDTKNNFQHKTSQQAFRCIPNLDIWSSKT